MDDACTLRHFDSPRYSVVRLCARKASFMKSTRIISLIIIAILVSPALFGQTASEPPVQQTTPATPQVSPATPLVPAAVAVPVGTPATPVVAPGTSAAPATTSGVVSVAPPVPTPPVVTLPAADRPSVVPPSAPERITLKEGTQVPLKFAQALSSKTAAEGDPVNFLLAEDLKVGNFIVAKAGTTALGTVSHAKKAGMMGKAGELNVRLEYLKCGDTRVRLRGSQGKEGEGKEGTAVTLTVLFGPVGLIKHGKNVEVKEGTALAAYVDQDAMLSNTMAVTEPKN